MFSEVATSSHQWTTEALFVRNEGIHVAGELALYMAITAVAIAGCTWAHFDDFFRNFPGPFQ